MRPLPCLPEQGKGCSVRIMGSGATLIRFVGQSLAPLVDLVFPPRCPLCGDALSNQAGLCSACWEDLTIPGEPCCAACSRPFREEIFGTSSQCGVCLASPPLHDGIAAATIYNEASRKLILAFKHGRRIALANQLGHLMAAKLPVADETGAILVPVPLHRWRLWSRGFNQAALLARVLEKHAKGRCGVDVLVRRKSTPMLGGMTSRDRARILRGAIQVNARWVHKIEGRDVILVDDVLTSGATTDACIRVLKKAGARSVRVACFARVLNESGSENITPEAKKTPGAT